MSVPPYGSPPGPPPQGQPPGYGAPMPYPQPVYAIAPPTNGLAVASLVCSLLGFSVLGVIFGHIALGQIRSKGESGHGLAVAGLIIGYIALALVVLWVVFVLVLGFGVAFWGSTSS